ncbi:MAG: hypothetical protein R3176_03895 [Woeseiaceae bacterium]|nr:hypothetical protein [Woeseiaceae bacterium]
MRRAGYIAAFVLYVFAGATRAEVPLVPVVYEDGNVLIRAGVAEAGNRTIHLGDAFSFVVTAEFDAGQVRVEAPDGEWLQRALAGVSGIRLYEPVAVAAETTRADRVRITSHWRLQALDCPAGELSCPGMRRYPLPVLTLAYELTGGGTGASDGRAARFRPWPGAVDVVPSLPAAPGPDADLADLIPGGAHAPGLDARPPPQAAAWLLPTAALLVARGCLAPRAGVGHVPAARRGPQRETRWERVLHKLADDALDDERWADGLRRAVTWYCLDELGRNPCSWLGPAAADRQPDDGGLAGWREFYLEVLATHDVGRDARPGWLARFRSLAGLPPEPAA